MNLEQFLDSPLRNLYLEEPEFEQLYVRKSRHYYQEHWYECFDIAKIEARHPGSGAFKHFLTRVHHLRPNSAIFVESVLSVRFSRGLRRMGFLPVPQHPGSFILLPTLIDLTCPV
jgi:hypothetical protein